MSPLTSKVCTGAKVVLNSERLLWAAEEIWKGNRTQSVDMSNSSEVTETELSFWSSL